MKVSGRGKCFLLTVDIYKTILLLLKHFLYIFFLILVANRGNSNVCSGQLYKRDT